MPAFVDSVVDVPKAPEYTAAVSDGDGVPPFNAVCEVVSKEYISDLRNRTSPIRYGLKFKTLSTETQKFLKDFTKRAA